MKKKVRKTKAGKPKARKKRPKGLKVKRSNKKRIKKTVFGRIYYSLNPKFQLLKELKDLILMPPPASFNKMAKKIGSLGRIKLALVSGVFLNKENVADLMIVGDDIDRRKFKTFLKSLEAEVGTQILYAIMDKEEFTYRRAMFDRFVRLMLEGPREILIDRVGL